MGRTKGGSGGVAVVIGMPVGMPVGPESSMVQIASAEVIVWGCCDASVRVGVRRGWVGRSSICARIDSRVGCCSVSGNCSVSNCIATAGMASGNWITWFESAGAMGVTDGSFWLMWYSLAVQLNGVKEGGSVKRILRGSIRPFASRKRVCLEMGSCPIETPSSTFPM